MRRVTVSFLLLFVFIVPAYAQYTSGQIVRAEYGTVNQFADVTQRVRSLAASTPRFKVNDDTLGVYSQAQSPKILRVFVRDRNGNSNQLTFPQNGYADLAAYAGNEGAYGQNNYPTYNQGGLQITSARYGIGYDTADVTNLLNSRLRNGQLNLQVSSNTLGGDPAPGRQKILSIHYTYNGRPAQAVYRDGEYVRLPEQYNDASNQPPYSNRGLEITHAAYGTWNHSMDVTSRLNSQVRNGQLDIQVTNASMGGDPARGADKTLNVDYRINGQQYRASAREGETLHLPKQGQYGATGNSPAGATQTLVCESNGPSRTYCPADTRGGVSLNRQIGNAACRQGSTWGYDTRGVWVSNYCRGEFRVAAGYGSSASINGNTLTITAGTELPVRTDENIDSSSANVGQGFAAEIAQDVMDNSGGVAIPKGSNVELVIRNTEGSNLVLDVNAITVGGRRYMVSTSDLEKKGGSGIGANKRTATMVGGGALAGAIIGAIAGGGKGAAIGAVLGGGAGAGAEVLTKGKQVKVPAETVLTFQLDSDLHLEQTSY